MNRFEALRAKPSYKSVEMNQYVKTIRHLPDEEKKQYVADMVNDPRVRLFDELTTLRNPDYKKQDAKASAMFGHVCEAVTGKAEVDLYGMTEKTAAGWLKVFDEDHHALFEKALTDDAFAAKDLNGADAWLIQGMAAIYARFAEYSERNVCKEKKLWLKAVRLYLAFFRCVSCESSYTYQLQREDVHRQQCEEQWVNFLDTVFERFLGRCIKSIEENDINTLQSQMNMLGEFSLLKVSAAAAQDRLVKAINEKMNYQFSLSGIGSVVGYMKTLPPKLIGEKILLTTLLDILRQQALARDNTSAPSKAGILELWGYLSRNTNIVDSNHVKLEREAFYMALGNTMINKLFGEVQDKKCTEADFSKMLAILPGDFDLTPTEGDESKKVRASRLIANFERDRLAALITPNSTESTMRDIARDAVKLVNRHLPNTKANEGPRAQILTHLVVAAQKAEEKMRVKRGLINAFAGALPQNEKLMVNSTLTSAKDFLEGRMPPEELIKKQIAAFKSVGSNDAAARRKASTDTWNLIKRISDGAGSQKEEVMGGFTTGLLMAAAKEKFSGDDMRAFTEAFPKNLKVSGLTIPELIEKVTPRDFNAEIQRIAKRAEDAGENKDKARTAGRDAEKLINELTASITNRNEKKELYVNILTAFVVALSQQNPHPYALEAFLEFAPAKEQLNSGGDKLTVKGFCENYRARWISKKAEFVLAEVKTIPTQQSISYFDNPAHLAARGVNHLYSNAVSMGQSSLAVNIATAAVVEAQKHSRDIFLDFIRALNDDTLINAGKARPVKISSLFR